MFRSTRRLSLCLSRSSCVEGFPPIEEVGRTAYVVALGRVYRAVMRVRVWGKEGSEIWCESRFVPGFDWTVARLHDGFNLVAKTWNERTRAFRPEEIVSHWTSCTETNAAGVIGHRGK